MPPFLQFRLWLREAPSVERVLAGLAVAIVVALAAVALVPVDRSSERTDLSAGPVRPTGQGGATGDGTGGTGSGASPGTPVAPGSTATAGAGLPTGSASTATDRDATPSPDGSAAAGGDAACSGLSASAPGVTPKEVRVDVSMISLAGPIGNRTFNIRPDLHEIADALTDEINRTGGIACGRKLVIKKYDVNPLDANDSQAKCLQMAEDNPYLVIDFGGYLTTASRSCFVQAKLPVVASLALGEPEATSSFPYVLSPRNLAEQQARNGILGLRDLGFFASPKFHKLGVFGDGCLPSVQQEIDRSLAEAGVKPNQVSTFLLSCNVAAPPNQVGQAVLQHKGDNVSHVFLATSGTNSQNYVRLANGQAFRPVYGGSDYGEVTNSSGSQNWGTAFDGATAITSQHFGELNSGIRNPELQACDEIARRHGLRGFEAEDQDVALGAFCDLFAFFRATTNNAGDNPTRLSFAHAMSTIGLFKTALVGDGNFNRPGKISGGDFRRSIRYHGDCTCWKILDRDFKPAFPR